MFSLGKSDELRELTFHFGADISIKFNYLVILCGKFVKLFKCEEP